MLWLPVFEMFKLMGRAVVLSVGVLACSVLSARAETVVKTAQNGNVRAELSYNKVESEGLPQFKDVRLKILRSGQLVFDRALGTDEFERPVAEYGSEPDQQSGFWVRDLNGDKEPEVVTDFYTGGAHCCTYSVIYHYSAKQNRYDSMQHAWGNLGYRLEDLDRDGQPEFRSGDDRFAYSFASYAGSAFPLQIWRYQNAQLVDVTRRYPKLIYSQAYQLWQSVGEAKNQRYEPKGVLAAYLADKYLLGQEQDGWRRVQSVYRESDRQEFFTSLRRFLVETGYAK